MKSSTLKELFTLGALLVGGYVLIKLLPNITSALSGVQSDISSGLTSSLLGIGGSGNSLSDALSGNAAGITSGLSQSQIDALPDYTSWDSSVD